ncbi:MAG: DNA/RNA non-specific endonuclease [Dysgonamonadaceae bacterium]|jgi:endonuclease G|nr:DNA/RNA non-specific endonuclease [Dysgonamonadaceae bacterium]
MTSKFITANIILIVTGFIIFSCPPAQQINSSQCVEQTETENSPVEKVEIPAKISGRQEQIISHTGYTVSYNSDWKIPNWAAYELTKVETEGIVPRSNTFLPDPDVAYEHSATTSDYKNSGWDRGHMVPSGDMKWSEQAMKESFYLSNICPQNNNLNSGVWKNLEEQVRGLASQKGKLYVVCGPIVSEQPQTIGLNKVAIPDAFFKALLQNDNGKWSAIAFLFTNESGRKPLSTYALTVEDIQQITGIDFFPALPDSIEHEIESQIDFTAWNIKTQ